MYTLEEHMQKFRRTARTAVRVHIAGRGVNTGALNAMNGALSEQTCWLDAGLLAQFRNWRNRR